MADLTAVLGLAALAITITGVFIFIRITHFAKEIPALIAESNVWLKEIESQLETEINTVASQAQGHRNFENVLSIASKFSAAKTMNDELDHSELTNSSRVKLDMGVMALIILDALLWYGSGFSTLNAADNLSGWAGIVAIFGGLLWALSLATFYGTYSQCSERGRQIRKRTQEAQTLAE